MTGTRTDAVKAVVAAARKIVDAAHKHPACLRHATSGAGGCVQDCPPHLIADLSNALITLDRRQGK